MTHELFGTRQTFKTGAGADGVFFSLPKLEDASDCLSSSVIVSFSVF
jgi:hypothetical protein